MYSGWQVIENAAVALDESVDTIAGDLADTCAGCHQIYRDPEGPKGFGDTSLRCKVLP